LSCHGGFGKWLSLKRISRMSFALASLASEAFEVEKFDL
jgi:hypothetical protein